MKNVITVAAAVATLALSNATFAGQPTGAAMVSTKIAPQTASTYIKTASNEVVANKIKSFQWGSTAARKQVTSERIVKAKDLSVKPPVITWPSTTGSTTRPARKKRQ